MKKVLVHFVLLLVPVFLPVAVKGDGLEAIAVIVHKDSAVDVLAKDDLRPIFQTKKTEWDNGKSILPFNMPDDNSVRQGFDSAVLGLDPDRVARYWVDRKIRGGARPPKTVPSAQRVISYVGRVPNAIGYVYVSEVDDSVKVVARIVEGQVQAP